jgi:hypothetical protein
MSTRYGPSSRRIWSLQYAQPGASSIAANGNSGAWPANSPTPSGQRNRMTPVDLRDVNDLAVMVSIAAIVSTPTIKVSVNVFDDFGNLYPLPGMATANLTAAGAAMIAGGSHGGATNYFVLPDWGQIAWTCSGGSATGVEIEVWGR